MLGEYVRETEGRRATKAADQRTYSLPTAGTKFPEPPCKRHEGLAWFTVPVDSVHGPLVPRQKCHGGRARESTAAQFTVAGKQSEGMVPRRKE